VVTWDSAGGKGNQLHYDGAEVILTPGALAASIRHRDNEWAAWEQQVVQSIVSVLRQELSQNYPGAGCFGIKLEFQRGFEQEGVWQAIHDAFGEKLTRLFASVNLVFSQVQWEMVGERLNSDYVRFNFRENTNGEGFTPGQNIGPVATALKRFPMLPKPPQNTRPALRGPETVVSVVLLDA
jgi:hypothetical protein